MQELRVVIDPSSGVRVSYQVVAADPFPRVSVGAGGSDAPGLSRGSQRSNSRPSFDNTVGPFNNSDSSNAWGSNHSVDAIFRLDTGLVGNVSFGRLLR